jgi:hypothetical protein
MKACGRRVLRKIFGPKMNEVRDNERYDLYYSPDNIRVIKSKEGGRWVM